MSFEAFTDVHEQARLAISEICAKAKLILQQSLPGIESLQQEKTHFSPGFMGMMCSISEIKLSESDRELLGSIMEYAEEFDRAWLNWHMVMRQATSPLDTVVASRECGEGVEALRRMSTELDGIRERASGL